MRFLALLFCFVFSMSSSAQVFDTLILFDDQSLLFKSDEWKLDVDSHEHWDSLLSIALTADKIILEGHTDEIGSIDYNQTLSSKRVNFVKESMIAANVPADKFQTLALGESRPAQLGSSESVYQWNRRVSLRFYQLQKRRTISGQIVDTDSGEGIKAKVKLTGKNFVDSVETKLDGRYSISAPDKAIYKLEISADNHFFDLRYIKISPLDPVEMNINLPAIKIGGEYTLPHFNFVGNMPVLLRSSVPTLEGLYKVLSSNTICIEIEGHINLPNQPDCGIETDYYKLSVDRAEMVYNSMIKKGIFEERMLPKGYGNWHMLFPTTRHEGEMKENRRVEIKVIDCQTEELLQHHEK